MKTGKMYAADEVLSLLDKPGPQGEILFVSHDATRTGAPIFLLRLVRWLTANTRIPITVLLRDGGPLEQDFARTCRTYCLNCRNPSESNKFKNKKILDVLSVRPIRLVYANTGAVGPLLKNLSALGVPIISHVHELGFSIRTGLADIFPHTKAHTTKYVAVSEAVRHDLSFHADVPREDIELIYEFCPLEEFSYSLTDDRRKEIRQNLGVPDSGFLVFGSGTIDWRKGPDLFVQLALMVKTLWQGDDFPFRFFWSGEAGSEFSVERLKHDAKMAGVDDFIKFLGWRDEMAELFGASDVFAMVSREDPFPIVCLEAAAARTPILCFEKGGGMPEFVSDGAGIVTPYLDIGAMAKALISLRKDPLLAESYGAKAAKKVRDAHTMAHGAEQVLSVIAKTLGSTYEHTSEK